MGWGRRLGGIAAAMGTVALLGACASAPADSDAAADTTVPAEATVPAAAAPVSTAPPSTVPAPTAPKYPDGKPVAAYKGAGNGETPKFTVPGTWDLRYKVTGGSGIVVELIGAGGEVLEQFALEPSDNYTRFDKGCTCSLRITSYGGAWEMTIVDVS